MRLTSCSAPCQKCTRKMVVAAKMEVPVRANLEPREAMVPGYGGRAGGNGFQYLQRERRVGWRAIAMIISTCWGL